MVSGMRSVLKAEQIHEDRVLIHHGSLSREIREEAEQLLQAGGDRICCCSSTLELGIDIGSARAVGHLDAPWSVASLAQRLGRSGRREGESAIFRQYHGFKPLIDLAPHDEEHLRPGLVRGIALLQLYLAGWCESAEVDRRHLSTLVHQIMSVIAESGGTSAEKLFRRLIGGDGFPTTSPEVFAHVLRHLGAKQVIEQISDGTLLLGAVGERELADRGFYAAFMVAEQYDVLNGNRRIGSVSIENAYLLGDGFQLGGRGWEVEGVDEQRLRIYVRPSQRRGLPKFVGQAGSVHDRVITMMHKILEEDTPVPFLDAAAFDALTSARAYFKHLQLSTTQFLVCDGSVVLWPWCGTRVRETLLWVLRGAEFEVNDRQLSLVISGQTAETVKDALRKSVNSLRETIEEGLGQVPAKLLWREKYDGWLPGDLLVHQLIEDHLDLSGAKMVIQKLLELESEASPS
jgi:ATP-dependent Lhr-like helicase